MILITAIMSVTLKPAVLKLHKVQSADYSGGFDRFLPCI